MSSLRVRAQNQILKQLGAAKPSRNVQFDVAHANFERTHASVAALESALRGFVVSLKGFHLSAQVLYGAIEAAGGSPDNSQEMKQLVSELKAGFVHVDVNAMNDCVRQFENRVMRPTAGWVGRASSLKHQISDFIEEKTKYDHYTRKVMGLREARDKRSAVGKSEKSKDVEKIVRNEQKLAAATNQYAKISESTITNLRDFHDTRESTLKPILQRTLEFRVQYANRIADESKLMHKMVHHDTAYDTVLRSLESFASKIMGVGREDESGSTATSHASADTSEPPVQAISFQSFVGEDPSQVPPPQEETIQSEMPPLPHPIETKSLPPPVAAAVPLHSPTSPMAGRFFDDFAPIQPLPSPPNSPSAPYPATFTPWDDVPPPPPSPPAKPSFSIAPASPSVSTPTFSDDWDSFSTMGGGDFQKMHQNAIQ